MPDQFFFLPLFRRRGAAFRISASGVLKSPFFKKAWLTGGENRFQHVGSSFEKTLKNAVFRRFFITFTRKHGENGFQKNAFFAKNRQKTRKRPQKRVKNSKKSIKNHKKLKKRKSARAVQNHLLATTCTFSAALCEKKKIPL